MAKVMTLKSSYVNGKIKKSKYTSIVKDVEKIFNDATLEAKLIARKSKGNVSIERTKTTLYINYLDVPNSKLIDVTKMVV